ncbi:glutamate--cysteine ligase [Okibacterium endophyticum]
MRTVGVEEELLLVSAESGRPRSVARRILRDAVTADDKTSPQRPGGSLEHELQQQQLETDTPPHTLMSALGDDIRVWRKRAIEAARDAGARVVASGTSPMPVEPRIMPDERYKRMAEHFGLTASEQLTCACHVHVAIESADEGVGVLDRVRNWLPTLVALSANSPFWRGHDTSYASFRSQAMIRWPTAGPTDVFGSANEYRALVDSMLQSGVILDEGMLYFDARLSSHYPTVEIRVADVCPEVDDAVLISALCRALVDTASDAWAAGAPPAPVPTAMLRFANWQAGRYGVEGDLLDAVSMKPRPAREVIASLVDHVRDALRGNGDEALVEAQIEQVLTRGTGSRRQRDVLAKTGQLADVVADLVRVTAGQD